MNLILELFKKVILGKGYKFFENGDFNLNMIYVRSENNYTNKYDDWVFCFWKEKGVWQTEIFPCSTKAGKFWTRNFFDGTSDGTAVVVPGQYLQAYEFVDNTTNWHQSPCLLQKGNIKIWRDGNKDNIIDHIKTQEGWFGIDLHWANGYYVDRWSAGCMVVPLPFYWDWIDVVRKCAKVWGNRFSVTLLEAGDLNHAPEMPL
ncbi:MAG: hypothetical protein NW226_17640 [Microscillaceae bacterium]|nr:hypothetical protein [Microscillaceae bacterium]